MSEGSDAQQGKYVSTLVVSPSGGAAPVAVGTSSMTTKTSSSKTTMTKTTKITKSSSSSTGGSSSSTMTTKTTESSTTGADGTSRRTFNTVTTKSSSNYADGLADRLIGTTDSAEIQRMVEEQMAKMNSQTFQLMPASSGVEAMPESSVVRLDQNSIMDYVDKSNNDMLALNFDMKNYGSETVHVKTVGNKVEVHACRSTQSSDGSQTKEEFSRSYEMPTSGDLNADHVTSGLYNDGVLTINLPISEATQ